MGMINVSESEYNEALEGYVAYDSNDKLLEKTHAVPASATGFEKIVFEYTCKYTDTLNHLTGELLVASMTLDGDFYYHLDVEFFKDYVSPELLKRFEDLKQACVPVVTTATAVGIDIN